MSDDVVYTSGKNGALFIQPSGPGTRPYYLACHDVDDIDIDKGTVNTLLQCFDVYGEWKTLGFTRTAPGLIDVTLGTYIGKTADRLEKIKCPFALYLLLRCGGRADLVTNYERLWIIEVANIGTQTLQNIVKMRDDAEAMQMFAAQAYPEVIPWFVPVGARQSTTEEKDLRDIAFCNDVRCAGRCGDAQDVCEDGTTVGESEAAGSPGAMGAVLNTSDGGANWADAAADPFSAGETVVAVECVQSPTTTNTIRKIVARGTPDAGNPAEIAWTEDNGATWNAVDVGTTNNQILQTKYSLFALDFYNIWAGTSGGYIYYSDDGGATWSIQEAGVITANGWRVVYFADELNGYAGSQLGVLAKTTDGGATWSAVTTAGTATITGMHVFDSQTVIVINADSEIYKTTDGGTTWNQITTFPLATGSLDAIDFINEYVGGVVNNTAGDGTVYVTFDGGYTWQLVSSPSNNGINAIYFCATDLFYAVGDRHNGTAWIAKYAPVS